MAIALLGGIAGCGGSKPESALHKEMSRVRAGACRSEVFNTARCGDEMQKVCETSVGTGSGEPAQHHVACELASEVRARVKKNEEAATPTQKQTPEEEAAHNEGVEAQRRYENAEAEGQKKVEEDETQGGEHSIRSTEEKVCYESGRTSEYCKSPEEKRELEAEAVAKRERERASGEVTVHE